jgi:hypothetical protein
MQSGKLYFTHCFLPSIEIDPAEFLRYEKDSVNYKESDYSFVGPAGIWI